ncbi:MAG TPA: hypothetical protein DCS30_14565 [Rhizobiales bacterium]|nr:hypothetical protein [Hyphomicrobiales bacterium]
MKNKLTKSVVHLKHEFSLPKSEQLYPPGDYNISYEEELIEGISWLAYRRKATFIEIPSIGTSKTRTEQHAIDFDELTAIMEWDK